MAMLGYAVLGVIVINGLFSFWQQYRAERAITALHEVPFDTDRKRLSTVHQTPKGVVLYCKGALEMVLPLCKRIQTGSEITHLNAESRQDYIRAQEEMASKGFAGIGLRVA